MMAGSRRRRSKPALLVFDETAGANRFAVAVRGDALAVASGTMGSPLTRLTFYDRSLMGGATSTCLVTSGTQPLALAATPSGFLFAIAGLDGGTELHSLDANLAPAGRITVVSDLTSHAGLADRGVRLRHRARARVERASR